MNQLVLGKYILKVFICLCDVWSDTEVDKECLLRGLKVVQDR